MFVHKQDVCAQTDCGIKNTDRFRYVCKFQRSYNETDRISRPLARLVEFQSGTQICRAGNSAGPAACENAHLFTLHPALESDPAPVLPVCVQAPLSVPLKHSEGKCDKPEIHTTEATVNSMETNVLSQ